MAFFVVLLRSIIFILMQTVFRDITNEVERVIVELLIFNPFFGRSLAKMSKDISSKYFGISISNSAEKGVQLCINPKYWAETLKTEEDEKTKLLRIAILKRQVLHFVFNHDLIIDQFKDLRLYIVATELVVQQFLKEEEIKEISLPATVEILQLPPFQPLKFYYDSLVLAKSKNKIDLSDFLKNGYFESLKKWLSKFRFDKNEIDFELRKQFISETYDANKESASHFLSTNLIAYFNQLIIRKKPSINWKRMLRSFYKHSKKTKLENTIHRPSKRYGIHPGTRIRKQSKILVALDTSGSINSEDLDLFFREIDHIWKQKAEIQIVECDTNIRRKYKYKGIVPNLVKGRGNTDFNEPIYFANDFYKPDFIVYLTDGFATKPRIKSSKPMLWLISPNGINEGSKPWEDLPGMKIKMNNMN